MLKNKWTIASKEKNNGRIDEPMDRRTKQVVESRLNTSSKTNEQMPKRTENRRTDGDSKNGRVHHHGVISRGINGKHSGDSADRQGAIVNKQPPSTNNGMVRGETKQHPAYKPKQKNSFSNVQSTIGSSIRL